MTHLFEQVFMMGEPTSPRLGYSPFSFVKPLAHKIIAITMDNASNNSSFVSIAISNGLVKGRDCLMRCFAHVLKLAADSALEIIEPTLATLEKLIKHVRDDDNELVALEKHAKKRLRRKGSRYLAMRRGGTRHSTCSSKRSYKSLYMCSF
ncbi:hypothetical protein K470DRAFT_261228 [Piedraia hortae CBS 480.64]|uniref:HAT C-terminal dimerisation domain-containing protein n=1 Tax=Piedraia hortae CBS 480.64 TaxID=1314780 RepID=A0A6A7C9W7_9PEZI|nr:hypothetical protein K470DRAFT_261228 [Piedraia hortae CBS 480.64]